MKRIILMCLAFLLFTIGLMIIFRSDKYEIVWSMKHLSELTGFDFDEIKVTEIKWIRKSEWTSMVICYDEDRPLDQVAYYNTGFPDKDLHAMPDTLVSKLIDIGIEKEQITMHGMHVLECKMRSSDYPYYVQWFQLDGSEKMIIVLGYPKRLVLLRPLF